jgi:ABC-2 type transport system permease protein
MASSTQLIPVKDCGIFNGFRSLFRRESRQWFGTWQWLVQVAIWLAIINGILATIVLAAPKIEAAQARAELSASDAAEAEAGIAETGLMVFFIFSGLAAATGVVIIAQDALIGEKQSGTAAWVLSKPVSRLSFILSKLGADALGVLVTMVLVQGAVAWLIYRAGTGIALDIPHFLGSLGLVYLALLFYLSLTYMLGSLFRSRGPVIGLPLLLVFGNSFSNMLPFLGKLLPWNLVMDLGPGQPALAVALAQGLPLPTITPILCTAGLTLVFIAVALWRFARQEF